VAPLLAELETVDVGRGPVLKGENQFVAGTIKRPHAAVEYRNDRLEAGRNVSVAFEARAAG
jgi:hypothetical protein